MQRTLVLVMLTLSSMALVPGVLAQEPDNATETEVTPEEDPESDLPTERNKIGEAPVPDYADEPNTVRDSEPGSFGEPEEASAEGILVTGLMILGVIAIGFIALLGVAYAAYERGGDRR